MTGEITIYTTAICPYCTRAKELLKGKGITSVNEIDVSNNEMLREEMLLKSGGKRTVPQIFIGSFHVGGFEELYGMEKDGKLDALLGK